ncbi:MFS transporter [Nocardioides sp. YIM 152315]|uniref:MFS transporter n=1 Tax=Nocardioides sp. YIM 152315 TaxID=3031760 RepID=UPI0023D9D86F|nr:MFS transporter [Nocardioides sp. YIM 152315]MDF1605358.1 MFS transporter [Nocardioides sp. YIM 152315]
MTGLRRDRLVQGWIALQGLSQAGDAVWTVALAWTAVQVASPAVAGLVVAAGTLPRAVLLLLGGVVADRLEARWVMLVVNLVRVGVLVATAVVVAVHGASPALLALAGIGFGACDAVFVPSAATIGRQLVPPEALPTYAGASQTVNRIGSMSGAAVGGAVVATWGLAGSALANAVTFGIVVGYLALALRPRYPLPRAESEPVLRGIARGFAHLRDVPATRTLVLTLSGLNLALTPALALGLALRVQESGWGAHTLGLLNALVGLSGAAGALALVRWRPRREASAGFWFLVLQGVAIATLGVGTVVSTAVACAVIGATSGAASALLSAVFVATVDGEYLGRMASIQLLGDDVLMPLAMVVFGAVASAVGVAAACTAFGLAMALLMAVPLSRPSIRAISLQREGTLA